jgi:hypothetical protein
VHINEDIKLDWIELARECNGGRETRSARSVTAIGQSDMAFILERFIVSIILPSQWCIHFLSSSMFDSYSIAACIPAKNVHVQ